MNLNTLRWSRRRRAVWAVPVLTAAVIAGSVALSSPASSSPHPSLPVRTAGQLLAAAESSPTVPLSGTVVETARLGLPALPTTGTTASLDWQTLVTGSHTALVWADGPAKQRLALTGQLSESDVIHNGRDLWTYTSATNEVSHTVLAGEQAKHTSPAATTYTPAQAAAAALKAIAPSTIVSVDRTQIVAGQKAYTLVLTPRDHRSTVSRVTIALDSKHFVPLRVQVFGRAAKPAFEVGFTSITFKTPAASVFNFVVPKGAKVVSNPIAPQNRATHGRVHGRIPAAGSKQTSASKPAPSLTPRSRTKVIGSGWTTVVELTGGVPTGAASGLLVKASRPVGSAGARLVTTSLLNVLILKDGRVFLGAVSAAMLQSTAAVTPR